MKDTGIVRWEFTGDVQLAQAYAGFARKMLGSLHTQNVLKLDDQRAHATVPGATIDVGISFGQKWARIHALPPGGEPPSTCYGFIVDAEDGDNSALCWSATDAKWQKKKESLFTKGLTGLNDGNQSSWNYTFGTKKGSLSIYGRRYGNTSFGSTIWIDGRLLCTASTTIVGCCLNGERLLVVGTDFESLFLYYRLFKTEYTPADDAPESAYRWITGTVTGDDINLIDKSLVQPIHFDSTGASGVGLYVDRKEIDPGPPPTYHYVVHKIKAEITAGNVHFTDTTPDLQHEVHTSNSVVTDDSYYVEDEESGTLCDCTYGGTTSWTDKDGNNGTSTIDISDSSTYLLAVDFSENDAEISAQVRGHNDFHQTGNCVVVSRFYTGTISRTATVLDCNPGYLGIVGTVEELVSTEAETSATSSGTIEQSANVFLGERLYKAKEASYVSQAYRATLSWSTSGSLIYYDTTCDTYSESLANDGDITYYSSFSDEGSCAYIQLIDYDLRYDCALYAVISHACSHYTVALYLRIGETTYLITTYSSPTFTCSYGEFYLCRTESGSSTNWFPWPGPPTCGVSSSSSSIIEETEDVDNPYYRDRSFTEAYLGTNFLYLPGQIRCEKDIYGHLLVSASCVIDEQYTKTVLASFGGDPVTLVSKFPNGSYYKYILPLGNSYMQ